MYISTYVLVFYHFSLFFFSVFCCHSLLLSILFILPCSVKVREGSNYWGPLGYEALTSPKSPQSPDPRTASKRVHIFKFRKRTDSKIPLCQRHNRWDLVLCVFVYLAKGNQKTQFEAGCSGARSSQAGFVHPTALLTVLFRRARVNECDPRRPDGLSTVTVDEKERFEDIKERLRVILENNIVNFR